MTIPLRPIINAKKKQKEFVGKKTKTLTLELTVKETISTQDLAQRVEVEVFQPKWKAGRYWIFDQRTGYSSDYPSETFHQCQEEVRDLCRIRNRNRSRRQYHPHGDNLYSGDQP